MINNVYIGGLSVPFSEWYELHTNDSICDTLMSYYGNRLPQHTRIYHKVVSEQTDVTPDDEITINRLNSLTGTFYVVEYPADPVTIIVAVVSVAVAIAASFLLAPSVPNLSLRNRLNESPNNELSDRQNKARVNARIPDIYGEVKATPDLLSVPYKVFEDNQEVEHAFMCIGRGEFEIDASTIKDDTTRIADINGAKISIYGPYTSPNAGNPTINVGGDINTKVKTVNRSNAINGQVLQAPNSNFYRGDNDLKIVAPNIIELKNDSDATLSDIFSAEDSVLLENGNYTGNFSAIDRAICTDNNSIKLLSLNFVGVAVGDTIIVNDAQFSYSIGAGSINLSGSYVVNGITSDNEVVLTSPELSNSDWNNLNTANFIDGNTNAVLVQVILINSSGEPVQKTVSFAGTYTIDSVSDKTIVLDGSPFAETAYYQNNQTEYYSPIISNNADKYIGPFVLDNTTADQILINFVALNGLYKDNGRNRTKVNVALEVELTPINQLNESIGPPELFTTEIVGTSLSTSTRAITLNATPTFIGRCSARVRRLTETDISFEGSVIDEVKIRDIYQMSTVSAAHFGNVTTIQSVTQATDGALAVKDRKLNLVVTRKIPKRIDNSTFSSELVASKLASDILCAVSLDAYIGNRKIEELDVDNIYDTIDEIIDYFGTKLAAEFCYTFDNDTLSFEEIVYSIANAVFCSAYRRGTQIKLFFEQSNNSNVLLFNHRNKLPGSERRIIRFGNQNNYDSVEYTYVSNNDDAIMSKFVPTAAGINVKKIESIGIRNETQAYFHAHRAWNKIRYQNIGTEFDCTQEAEILIIGDRVLVANNTRPATVDGEVVEQKGLSLVVSQPCLADGLDTIYLQHTDGSVESVNISSISDDGYTVLLATPPKQALAVGSELFAKATFIATGPSSGQNDNFIVTEKESSGKLTLAIKAINYDSRYYQNDKDLISGLIQGL